ncbi:MAG: citrate transporter [Candidatus Melainabacteria bacterium HGW-Melainabacteria-1]|nr:MAG: citrate transporter [Candidatus Melainabacteria bacterium HGW-Melainabacteria-1]
MEALQIGLLFLSFVVMTLLMFYRLLPAILALPLLAVLIALIGGMSPHDDFTPLAMMTEVLSKGPIKLHGAYVVAMFGGMLSLILQKTGVAESFIKKGAELAGDKPWTISVIMLLLIALLFTTLGGLGAIIMVATIVLPVLSAVGVGPMTSVGIFLFGISIGGTLNVGNWALYREVMKLEIDQIRPFALLIFAVLFGLALVYITVQLYFDGHELQLKSLLAKGLLALLLIGGGTATWMAAVPEGLKGQLLTFWGPVWLGLQWLIGLSLAALLLYVLLRAWRNARAESVEVHWTAYAAPILPLILILTFGADFIAAFVAGLLYAFAATYRRGRLNTLIQASIEGAAVVMPAVLLMFGIGMILIAIMGPGGAVKPEDWPVLQLIQPVTAKVVPTSAIGYILLFSLAAPLALYRGPLNLWGMGFGLASVFMAAGLPPAAVMGLLMSVGQIQGISDPTNTQNVWLASEMRVDVQKVMWNTLPYAWITAVIGLCASAMFFMGGR